MKREEDEKACRLAIPFVIYILKHYLYHYIPLEPYSIYQYTISVPSNFLGSLISNNFLSEYNILLHH
jgi:hypothetical protein